MQPVSVEQSRSMPLGIEDVFDRIRDASLPEIFSRRHMMLPPITEVRGQPEPWGSVGQSRTIVTSDGGSLREELTCFERPTLVQYRITDIRGPMKPLVRQIEGVWRFSPDSDGTRVTWGWTLHPTSIVMKPTVALIGKFWVGYAEKALAEAEKVITG
jgi:hypothetical protein